MDDELDMLLKEDNLGLGLLEDKYDVVDVNLNFDELHSLNELFKIWSHNKFTTLERLQAFNNIIELL